MKTKFSIIIPIYNSEKYLRNTLNSVCGLDYDNYEIICIDDCSTDNSISIVEEYKLKFPYIYIERERENGGVSKARNRGLDLAKGDYVLFLDSDDFFYTDKLLKIFDDIILKNENCECIYFPGGGFFNGKDDGKDYYDEYFYKTGYECIEKNCLVMKHLTFGSPVSQCYKLSVINSNEKLRFKEGIQYGEDRIFTIEFFLRAKNIVQYTDPLYCYNQRENSLVTNNSEKAIQKKINDGLFVAKYLFDLTKIFNGNNFLHYVNILYFSPLFASYKRGEKIEIDYNLLYKTSPTIKNKLQSLKKILNLKFNRQ